MEIDAGGLDCRRSERRCVRVSEVEVVDLLSSEKRGGYNGVCRVVVIGVSEM